MHNTVINNYNPANPITHCVLSNIPYLNYNTPVYQFPQNAITTPTTDIDFFITPSNPVRGNIPLPNCPIYGSYKRSGIQPLHSAIEMKISPNPTSNKLIVELINPRDYSITINDINGKNIKALATDIIDDKIQIDVTSIVDGIYFINLLNKTNQEKFTEKFIKN